MNIGKKKNKEIHLSVFLIRVGKQSGNAHEACAIDGQLEGFANEHALGAEEGCNNDRRHIVGRACPLHSIDHRWVVVNMLIFACQP